MVLFGNIFQSRIRKIKSLFLTLILVFQAGSVVHVAVESEKVTCVFFRCCSMI